MLYQEYLNKKRAERLASRGVDTTKLDYSFLIQLLQKPKSLGYIEVSKSDYGNFQGLFDRMQARQKDRISNILMVVSVIFGSWPFLIFAFNAFFGMLTKQQFELAVIVGLTFWLGVIAFVVGWYALVSLTAKFGKVHDLTVDGKRTVFYYISQHRLKRALKTVRKC